jgi:hypothetical protein
MATLEMHSDKFTVLLPTLTEDGYHSFVLPTEYNSRMRDIAPNWEYREFKRRYNGGKDFELKILDDIPENSKYIAYLSVYNHLSALTRNNDSHTNGYKFDFIKSVGGTENNVIIPMELPPRILNDSLNGNVLWIIHHDTESEIETLFYYDRLLESLGCTHHPRNVVLATAAEVDYMYDDQLENIEKLGISIFNSNCLMEFVETDIFDDNVNRFIINKIVDISNKKILPYKSLCYNRALRPHRVVIMLHMIKNGYLQDSIASLNAASQTCPIAHSNSIINKDKFNYLHEEFIKICDNPRDIVPIFEEDIDLNINQAQNICLDHPMISSFQIVTESLTTNYTFITEKSYKPFLMMQPFIQFGSPMNLLRLRHMGFRLFDQWINHSYDTIRDHDERLVKFLVELDRLHNIDQETWAQMLYEMREDLIYNFNWLNHLQQQGLASPPPGLLPIVHSFFDKKGK